MADLNYHIAEDVCIKLSQVFDPLQLENIKYAIIHALSAYEVKEVEKSIVEYDFTKDNMVQSFLVSKKVAGLSDNTLRFYFCTLRDFFSSTSKAPQDVLASDIITWLSRHKLDGNTNTHLNNLRRNISSFFSWLHNNGFIAKNPMISIQKIKTKEKPIEPFTDAEIEALRNACYDVRSRALLEVLLSTGCRIGEIASAKLSNYSPLEKELVVVGKGDKVRIVLFNAVSIFYLKQYLDTRTDNNDCLFVGVDSRHNPLTVPGLEGIVKRISKKAGVPAHPHKFRHTTATLLVQRGMPIEQVQKLLGHSKMDTTLIYAKTSMSEVKFNHQRFL